MDGTLCAWGGLWETPKAVGARPGISFPEQTDSSMPAIIRQISRVRMIWLNEARAKWAARGLWKSYKPI